MSRCCRGRAFVKPAATKPVPADAERLAVLPREAGEESRPRSAVEKIGPGPDAESRDRDKPGPPAPPADKPAWLQYAVPGAGLLAIATGIWAVLLAATDFVTHATTYRERRGVSPPDRGAGSGGLTPHRSREHKHRQADAAPLPE